jgi:hypothetical protein
VPAGAALALFAGLVVYPAAAGDRLVPLVIAVGSAGWALLALGLLRWPALIGWGLAGFGAEYAVFLRLRGGSVDSRAPAVAAALLLVAELAFLSARGGIQGADRAFVARVVASTAAAVAGTALLADLLLVASGSANGSLGVEAGGVLASVLVVALVVRVAARGATPRRS